MYGSDTLNIQGVWPKKASSIHGWAAVKKKQRQLDPMFDDLALAASPRPLAMTLSFEDNACL
jgi:hypothetical protein